MSFSGPNGVSWLCFPCLECVLPLRADIGWYHNTNYNIIGDEGVSSRFGPNSPKYLDFNDIVFSERKAG